FVRRESPDMEGPLTESNIESLRADLAIVGADGIDLQGNVYNESLNVARMLSKMVAAAGAVYVVADSTKIGKTALSKFGNVSKWRGLITDDEITPQQLSALKQVGAQVTVVGRSAAAEQAMPSYAQPDDDTGNGGNGQA